MLSASSSPKPKYEFRLAQAGSLHHRITMRGDARNWKEEAYRETILKEREIQTRTVFRTVWAPSLNPNPEAIISSETSDFSYLSSSSISNITQAFPFSSGNPRIEQTRGIILLYHDDADASIVSTSPSNLPVGRKPLVCVLGVPNHMTYADF